jgi:hypothetical protein
MDVPRELATAVVATGLFLVASPLAAQNARPPDLMRVQADDPLLAVRDRMDRLRRHRAAIENALGSPRPAMPAEPMEPETRALRTPEPAGPAEEPPMTSEAHIAVSCDEAAGIVADFGFSDVRARDCSGDLYSFAATRDAIGYSIAVTAATGEIAEVSRE